MTTTSLNRIRDNNNQNYSIPQCERNSAENLENTLACTPPYLLKALNLSSIPLSSTVNISKSEAEERHLLDKQKWDFSFLDIFKPKVAFNKLLNRILYQFRNAHRSDFDTEFRKILQAGVPLEKHLVKTSDSHSVELWFAKSQHPEAKTKIYFHGNASNIANSKEQAIEDYKQGYNVCLFSYRGYSGNHGYPSEAGLIDDTNSVIDFLKSKQNIQTQDMDFEAHSLGSAVLLNTLAHRVSRNHQESFGNILLMSPFKSMGDMIKTKTKIIPKFLINLLTNTWNNFDAISNLKGKVKHIKIMHGKSDKLIPIEHSRDLYQHAQNNSISAELIELENIGHNDIRREVTS